MKIELFETATRQTLINITSTSDADTLNTIFTSNPIIEDKIIDFIIDNNMTSFNIQSANNIQLITDFIRECKEFATIKGNININIEVIEN